MTMHDYALERGSLLLRRLAFQMHRAARLRDPESIHDLRVSIRRFQQCLAVFGQFFPRGQAKKIRRRLHQIMQVAGEIRNRDIALELLEKSSLPLDITLQGRWREEARQVHGELVRLLGRWGRRDLSRRWGSRLGLQ
jgi:CHAD domain-containing protein